MIRVDQQAKDLHERRRPGGAVEIHEHLVDDRMKQLLHLVRKADIEASRFAELPARFVREPQGIDVDLKIAADRVCACTVGRGADFGAAQGARRFLIVTEISREETRADRVGDSPAGVCVQPGPILRTVSR